MSFRPRMQVLAFASPVGAGAARARTVAWVGGFPNDGFSVATSRVSGATSPVTGTASGDVEIDVLVTPSASQVLSQNGTFAANGAISRVSVRRRRL
jgi:hypothetical protein